MKNENIQNYLKEFAALAMAKCVDLEKYVSLNTVGL